MDAAGLTILMAEMQADCAVVADAAGRAAARLPEATPGHLEACAYELGRLYNVVERLFERVCEHFENHFDKQGAYHEKLILRLSLSLNGIRPAFIPADQIERVRELKGFRHVTRHAYDLVLKPERLAELTKIAGEVALELPQWCAEFAENVRAEQGW
jgi:hypothetical protein